MLLKTPLKHIATICLLFMFSIVYVSAAIVVNDPENPFDGSKIKNAGGGPAEMGCVIIDLNPNGFNFTITLENLDDNLFPCDLHVGITNPFGSTDFVQLTENMFSPIPSSGGLNLFQANISGGELSYEELAQFKCIDDEILVPFYLNLLCKVDDEYIPVDYCEDYDLFVPFFGNIIPPDQCHIGGLVYLDFCCDQKGSEEDEIGEYDEFNIVKRSVNDDLPVEIEVTLHHGAIEVNANDRKIEKIYIRNIAGQIVQSNNFLNTDDFYRVELLNIHSGLYFITCDVGDKIITKKMFIQ